MSTSCNKESPVFVPRLITMTGNDVGDFAVSVPFPKTRGTSGIRPCARSR